MIYGIPPLVNVEREMSSAILKTKLNKLLPKRQDVVLIKGVLPKHACVHFDGDMCIPSPYLKSTELNMVH